MGHAQCKALFADDGAKWAQIATTTNYHVTHTDGHARTRVKHNQSGKNMTCRHSLRTTDAEHRVPHTRHAPCTKAQSGDTRHKTTQIDLMMRIGKEFVSFITGHRSSDSDGPCNKRNAGATMPKSNIRPSATPPSADADGPRKMIRRTICNEKNMVASANKARKSALVIVMEKCTHADQLRKQAPANSNVPAHLQKQDASLHLSVEWQKRP